MNGRPSYPVIVFDLDGTLVDSVPDIALAINEVLVEYGRPPLPVSAVAGMMGDGAPEMIERAFAAAGNPAPTAQRPEMAARLQAVYAAGSHELSTLYPGVPETLAKLAQRGLRLGVCTNQRQAAARATLGRFGIEGLFSAVIGGDSTGVLKPDPRILQAALDRLGAAPSETVMVGDSRNDVLVARRLGVKTVTARYGYPEAEAAGFGADMIIDAMAELPAALIRLERLASPDGKDRP